ncbi:MAG: tetratricopeptide repeat protein [Planctomycetes bacterium]|nr:tetratricopeptide repeat protein [Planctomycetota bacterium]
MSIPTTLSRITNWPAYNFTGQPHDALDVITRARKRWPEHPRLAAQAGEAFRLLEDWPAAERDLREAAEKMPGHTITHYHLALVLEHLNRDEESVRILESLVARNPGFLPAWTAIGRLRWAAGDAQSAIDAYEYALKINPNHRGALLSLAGLYASKQNWPAAIDLLNKITASDSRDAQAGFQLAVALVQVGRLSVAFDIYSRLIEHDDANTALRFNRAAVAEQLGNTAVAEQDYLYVIAERPEFMEPYVALHEILAAERRFDRMIELWQHREAGLPKHDDANAALIWAYLLANQWERAAPLLEGVADHSPVAGMVRWATACHLLMAGDDATLREWIMQNQSGGLSAFVADASDDWRMRIIQSSIDALPDSIKKSRAGHVFLAEFLVMRNQIDAATTTLERVVAENPDDQWVSSRMTGFANSRWKRNAGTTPVIINLPIRRAAQIAFFNMSITRSISCSDVGRPTLNRIVPTARSTE